MLEVIIDIQKFGDENHFKITHTILIVIINTIYYIPSSIWSSIDDQREHQNNQCHHCHHRDKCHPSHHRHIKVFIAIIFPWWQHRQGMALQIWVAELSWAPPPSQWFAPSTGRQQQYRHGSQTGQCPPHFYLLLYSTLHIFVNKIQFLLPLHYKQPFWLTVVFTSVYGSCWENRIARMAWDGLITMFWLLDRN